MFGLWHITATYQSPPNLFPLCWALTVTANGKSGVRKTCSMQSTGWWRQRHASSPTSLSTCGHTHTHTRRGRAAVVRSYGMFRSGYTPSSWIPWRPNLRKDTPSIGRCLIRDMFHFTVPWTHPCTVETNIYVSHHCGIEHIYTDNMKLAMIPRIRGSQSLWRLKSFRLKISHDIGYAALCVAH